MKSGIINKILSSPHTDLPYIKIAIWATSNVFCMKEFCNFCDLRNYMPTFLKVIKTYTNDK